MAFNTFFLQIFNSVFKFHLFGKTIKTQENLLALFSLVLENKLNDTTSVNAAGSAPCLKTDMSGEFCVTASGEAPLWLIQRCGVAAQGCPGGGRGGWCWV